MKSDFCDKFRPVIEFIIIIGLIVVVVALATNYENQVQENKWNNGRCTNCGQEWRFEQAVGHHNTTNYLYVCDNCSNTIELKEYHGN